MADIISKEEMDKILAVINTEMISDLFTHFGNCGTRTGANISGGYREY